MEYQKDWLARDPCPAWCCGDHPPDQHPDDRAHSYPLVIFPVISDGGRSSPTKRAIGLQHVIDIRRYPGNGETWVFVGDEADARNSFCITLESAARLHRQLGFALREVAGG